MKAPKLAAKAGRGAWLAALLGGFALLTVLVGLTPTRAERAGEGSGAPVTAALRTSLERASASAAQGRSLVVVGDAALRAGTLAHMRAELAPQAELQLHGLHAEGLTLVDTLALVAALDQSDPHARVELAIELDLRDLGAALASARDCAQPAICRLADPWAAPPGSGDAPGFFTPGLRGLEHAGRWARSAIGRRVASWRPAVSPFAAARGSSAEAPPAQASPDAEIVSEGAHAGLDALDALLTRLELSGRRATFFLPPLANAQRNAALGAHVSALATRIQTKGSARLRLVDLDHPLFSAGYFGERGLSGEGERLLAINVLHELGLPLARRPFEWMMAHPEGVDRSLVHRVGQGAGQGGAAATSFAQPDGVAVNREGTRIIVADTQNHVLRELRGAMQVVELAAGSIGEAGASDGLAREQARLSFPRRPELRPRAAGSSSPAAQPDEVWFIDGEARERVRVYADGKVSAPAWSGPGCAAYRVLRARVDAIWMLCDDSRLILLDPERGQSRALSDVSMSPIVSFDVGPEQVYFADERGSLWERAKQRQAGAEGASKLSLARWKPVFRNPTGVFSRGRFLPTGRRIGYPYHYDDVRIAKVLDLRYIERYDGLLVADEFPLLRGGVRLEREWTERVHLRFFDLEVERILPWVKSLTHGEAHATYNQSTLQFSAYWHLGTMAVAQEDASMVWLERERSRLIHVADGMLGVAKTGNHHTTLVSIPKLQTLAAVSRKVESQMRPDRYLERRSEPRPRRGPFVGLVLGSSLSSMSDRYSNYSLGRRIELELQRELGYRDGIRLDLFQVSWPAATFGEDINNFNNWMSTSVPPDLLLIEAHDFGSTYLKDTPTPADVTAAFAKLQRLADRYDTLVAFYDISSIEANRRDSMRSTDEDTAELLAQAEELGFIVLDPGDELLPRLLTHSPWGCQPFADNQHHGSTWSIDQTAELIAVKLAPILRERWATREPVRRSEKLPRFFKGREGKALRTALATVELDEAKLIDVDAAYLQTNYVDGELFVYVDLAGIGGALADQRIELLAVSVIAQVLANDVYAELARSLTLELVEFANYDEYGNGVLDSATTAWRRRFDHESLASFLGEHAP